MDTDIKITHQGTRNWNTIETICQKIKRQFDAEVAYPTELMIICASELCENAIKYGTAVPGMEEIQFELRLTGQQITIQVSNGIPANDDLAELKAIISAIKRTSDPAKLYNDRLQALMESPNRRKTQLGLYRIVHEAGFKLDYTYHNRILCMIASRDTLPPRQSLESV